MTMPDRPPPRRVLVSRLDNVGDVLLAGPAVRAVAAAADVVFLTSPAAAPAAALLPGVSRIIAHRAAWIDPSRPPIRRPALDQLVTAVAGLGIDEACILGSSHQSPLPLALLLRLAGVGTITAVSHEYPGTLVDRRIPGDPDLHEVERDLLVAATAGFPLPDGDDGRLRVRGVQPPSVEVPTGAVVVHPGASVPARTLSPTQWRSVVACLTGAGHPVVVTGTADEAALVAAVAVGEARPLVGLPLAEFAGAVATARAVVCGNTGPAHLASAVGTPVVEAYAPTVPAARWAPWRVPHVLLGDQGIACAGCRSRTCTIAGQPCIGWITGTDVLEALDALDAVDTRAAVEVTA
jgi:ADP-heptose:LPS heptosyltransferase